MIPLIHLPNIEISALPIYAFSDFSVALGKIAYAYQRKKMCLLIGHPGCGKSTLLVQYAKTNSAAVYLAFTKPTRSKDMLLRIASSIDLRLDPCDTHTRILQQLLDTLQSRQELIFLIDEADRLCVRNIDKLDILRYIWDFTNIPFVFAGPIELELAIKDSNSKVTYSQFYRRTQQHVVRGMGRLEAAAFLDLVEIDFNVVYSQDARSQLIAQICDTTHGGIGNGVENIEACLSILLPGWFDFESGLRAGKDRVQLLKALAVQSHGPITISRAMVDDAGRSRATP